MASAFRGVGLVRRAVLLVTLTGITGAGILLLLLQPEVTTWLQRAGWSMSFGVRLGTATLLTMLLGALLARWLFVGADRSGRAALDAVAMTDGEAEVRPEAERPGLAQLAAAVLEWRHRVRAAEAARQRFEDAARELARSLEAVGATGDELDGAGASLNAAAYEDESLRRLATAAQGRIEAAARLRVTVDALLDRVMEDLAGISEPFQALAETLAGMGSVLEDLVATWPDQPALIALQAALDDCSAEVARAGQAAGFVDRELTAVRRRLGVARLERLTNRDLLNPDLEQVTRQERE